MKIKLNVDIHGYSNKPVDVDQKGINIRLAAGQREWTLKKLSTHIEQGCTFTPAYLNTHYPGSFKIRRKAECWTSQQLFALDFDNEPGKELSVRTALERCQYYNLAPCIIYHSYSSTPNKEKYRLLFQLEQPVTDCRTAKVIQSILMYLFPECDGSCRDRNRMFFGTNKKIKYYKSSNFLKVDNIATALITEMSKKNQHNYARNMKTFCAANYLAVYNNLPGIVHDPKTAFQIANDDIEKIDDTQGIYFVFTQTEHDVRLGKVPCNKTCRKQASPIVLSHKPPRIKNIDYELLAKKCELIRHFMTGDNHIDHADMVRIISNLLQVNGGEKWFLSTLSAIMDNYPGLYRTGKEDKLNKMSMIFKSFRKNNYHPYSCSGASSDCPYIDTCIHGNNLLAQVKLAKNEVVALAQKQLPSITMAEKELDSVMNKIFHDKALHIVKASTGIGKTEQYIKLVHAGDIIAVPTHKLAEEIKKRLEKIGKSCLVASKRPKLAFVDQIAHFELLIKIGNISGASAYYVKKVEEYRQINNKTGQQIQCIHWLQEQEEIQTTDKIIVCTHAKLLALSPDHRNIIIDEDILPALVKTFTIALSDMRTIAFDTSLSVSIRNKIISFVNAIESKIGNKEKVIIEPLPLTNGEAKQILATISMNSNKYTSAIGSLFNPSMMMDDEMSLDKKIPDKQFSSLVKLVPAYQESNCQSVSLVKLNLGLMKKENSLVILSATANQKLCAKIMSNIQYHEINAHPGNILWHYHNTYSRTKLKKLLVNDDDEYLSEIKTIVDNNMPVITYSEFKKTLLDAGFNTVEEIHYGKTAGFDFLKGKDMAVIGTPHVNERAYLILAAALDVDTEQEKLTYQVIERNGFRFWFYTYQSEMMQEIQLHLIEAELIQAVGRARASRTSATVHLFSGMPVPGARLK